MFWGGALACMERSLITYVRTRSLNRNNESELPREHSFVIENHYNLATLHIVKHWLGFTNNLGDTYTE
jgi:hypothetical protein